MKRSLIAAAATVATVTGAALYRGKQVIDNTNQPKLTLELNYTIPSGTKPITLATRLGEVKLLPAFGYEAGKAIWVQMPEGLRFSTADEESYSTIDEIAQDFFQRTGGHFRMEPCTTQNTAVISAGWDQSAYEANQRGADNGYTGYWKHNHMHPVPHLDEIAAILASIIDPKPYGPIRAGALDTLDRLRDRLAA